MQAVEVFKDPDAGTAMDRGDGQADYLDALPIELEKALHNVGIVEKIVFPFHLQGHGTRLGLQFIKIGKPV